MNEPSDHSNGEVLPAPIKPAGSDMAHAVVRAALGSVPIAGSALQELFTVIVAPPLERRKHQWMENVAERLVRLEAEERIDFATLPDNEGFVTVVMNATHAAMRTHDNIKLEALRNAVVNSTLPGAPDDALKVQFVALVENLTGWHLRLLAYLANPTAHFAPNDPALSIPMRDIVPGVEEALGELRGKRDLILQLYRDLGALHLVSTDVVKVKPGLGALAKRTTDLADALLAYVLKDPAPDPVPSDVIVGS